MPVAHTLHFQSTTGPVQFSVSAGDTVLVAGPNGVGKSALLASLYRSLPQHLASYLPGHRQVNFNNGWETIGQDAAQLQRNLFQQIDAFSRYKGAWAEDQFKVTVRTLLHSEAAFNRDFRKNGPANPSEAAKLGTLRVSPIDTLNLIFQAARLPVQFDLTDQGLTATRGPAVYSIDALSDGERAALFLVAAIITLPPDGVLLVDEPEKHLHPSISGLLMEAALRSKRDAVVILSSHDVHLIEQLEVASIIHIRDSTVIQQRPEVRQYEATVVSGPQSIAEDLKRDLLGTRSSIVFVEGDLSSIDIALYGHVYPNMKISPKGGHAQVSESVKALRSLGELHWLRPYGLIDGDGRDTVEVSTLQSRGVHVLPCPTVENLFFLPEAIACFVVADNEYIQGLGFEERTADLRQLIVETTNEARTDIASRWAAWVLDRRLSESKLSPKQIKDSEISDIVISVSAIIEQVTSMLDNVLASEDWAKILFKLPIKNTRIPSIVSAAVGAPSFDRYRQVILRQLDVRSDASKPLLAALKLVLPALE